MKQHHLIYLIGFMASGKTSVGRKLAKKLAVDFLDLDFLIEENERMSISRIFEVKGEVYFRAKEAELLRNISKKNKCIVALGGGTACHSNNMKYINSTGLSVYLKRSNQRLLGRLRQKKAKRPLIANLSDIELKSFIDKKMEERVPFFEEARWVINADAFTRKNDLIHYIEDRIGEGDANF